MATQLPIVATNVGGNPELIEEGVNGLLVSADQDRVLAEAILYLTQQPQIRKSMGEKSLQKIKENFDWLKTVKEYLDVYDNLLDIDSRGDAHKCVV